MGRSPVKPVARVKFVPSETGKARGKEGKRKREREREKAHYELAQYGIRGATCAVSKRLCTKTVVHLTRTHTQTYTRKHIPTYTATEKDSRPKSTIALLHTFYQSFLTL